MASDGKDTTELFSFFNTLFDSVNGTIDIINDKYEHEMILLQFFKSMEYEKHNQHNKKFPNVLKNWIHKIKNFKV